MNNILQHPTGYIESFGWSRSSANLPRVKRIGIVVGVVALVAVLVIGLSQAGGGGGGQGKSAGGACGKVSPSLSGAPAPLASLYGQGCRLLGGGPAAFKARLASLRGHPVVVNQWASWCGPCRAEFPHFQRLSLSLGKRVAFLGVDSMDNNGDAAAFLERYPVAYPSYIDGDGKVAQVMGGVGPLPKTVFYSRSGKLQYVHVGQYPNAAALRRDISRYAGA
jgi:cytochrome c biogenesis protein CcmG, thiol:disulfide interchange protein DsbE